MVGLNLVKENRGFRLLFQPEAQAHFLSAERAADQEE